MWFYSFTLIGEECPLYINFVFLIYHGLPLDAAEVLSCCDTSSSYLPETNKNIDEAS